MLEVFSNGPNEDDYSWDQETWRVELYFDETYKLGGSSFLSLITTEFDEIKTPVDSWIH